MTAVIHQHSRPSFRSGYARSAAESAHPNLWRGLKHAWVPYLGITGDVLHDLAGSINLSESGAEWRVNAVEHGGTFAVQFQSPATHDMEAASGYDFTVMCHAFADVDGSDNLLGTTAAAGGWKLATTGSGTLRFESWVPNRLTCDLSNGLPAGEWRTVFGTHQPDAPRAELWVNGSSAVDTTNGTADTSDGNPFGVLCGGNSPSATFDGAIRVVCIWDRVLSEQEKWALTDDPLAPFRRRIYLPTSEQVAAGANTRRYSLTLTGVG